MELSCEALDRLQAETGLDIPIHVDGASGGFLAPFRSVLSRIGDKWSVTLVGMLHDWPLRFTELKQMASGISGRMLMHTLRQLERNGLVDREIFAEVPPRVVYSSTPLGKSLAVPVMVIAEWAAAHQAEITENRDRYDEDSAGQ